MADYVTEVVEAEGPVHLDEIASRIRILWGLQRAGTRIRACVAAAAEAAAAQGRLEGGPSYVVPGQTVAVRDRSAVGSASLRRPEMLPPSEVEAALATVVRENYGAARGELIPAAARLFGFAATSGPLRAVLEQGLARLLASGALEAKGELVTMGRGAFSGS